MTATPFRGLPSIQQVECTGSKLTSDLDVLTLTLFTIPNNTILAYVNLKNNDCSTSSSYSACVIDHGESMGAASKYAAGLGATLAFLIARLLLRDWVQERYGERLKAINEGMVTLQQDAVRKLLAGQTTIEEILRVTHSSEFAN